LLELRQPTTSQEHRSAYREQEETHHQEAHRWSGHVLDDVEQSVLESHSALSALLHLGKFHAAQLLEVIQFVLAPSHIQRCAAWIDELTAAERQAKQESQDNQQCNDAPRYTR